MNMGNQYIQPTTVTDSNDKEITAQRTAQGWVVADGEGNDLITLGYNKDGTIGLTVSDGASNFVTVNQSGFQITDGTVTFISISQDGIVLNDGSTDRILIGKDVGGF